MDWNTSEATLVYDDSAFVDTTCCYREILREGTGMNTDNEFRYLMALSDTQLLQNNQTNIFFALFRLLSCKKFNKTMVLKKFVEFIYVNCEHDRNTVYKNTHAIIRDKPEIRKRLTKLKERSKNNRPLSVLMLSIDSISRLNFIRSMPETYKSLLDNEWFELQGYNKVSDKEIQ